MTVCVTGDVHHMSLETRDQAYMDVTELEAAVEYARIAEEYGVAVTLFVTGKAAVEDPDRVERLAAMDHVEIGGHNYYAFGTPLHTAFRGLLGTWNGPRRFQSWEIRKTVSAFEDLGIEIRAWRDHAYRHDRNTAGLLSKHGITHFSDAVGPDLHVCGQQKLTVVPINTPPDHEHLYHAFRTPEFVRESDFEGPFGTKSYPPGEWLDRTLAAVDRITTEERTATVLAHPSCMRLANRFETFENLCRAVSDRRCTPVRAVSPRS